MFGGFKSVKSEEIQNVSSLIFPDAKYGISTNSTKERSRTSTGDHSWNRLIRVLSCSMHWLRTAYTLMPLGPKIDPDQHVQTPMQCHLSCLNTTPRRLRPLRRHSRILDPKSTTSNQSPPLQVLLNLTLHTTAVMLWFPIFR